MDIYCARVHAIGLRAIPIDRNADELAECFLASDQPCGGVRLDDSFCSRMGESPPVAAGELDQNLIAAPGWWPGFRPGACGGERSDSVRLLESSYPRVVVCDVELPDPQRSIPLEDAQRIISE